MHFVNPRRDPTESSRHSLHDGAERVRELFANCPQLVCDCTVEVYENDNLGRFAETALRSRNRYHVNLIQRNTDRGQVGRQCPDVRLCEVSGVSVAAVVRVSLVKRRYGKQMSA